MAFRVLYKDNELVVIDKPAGFHTHSPEDGRHQVSANKNCLFRLREQMGSYLFPVHRLDVATSGVLIFALTQKVAQGLNRQFQEGRVHKKYLALVRGWFESSVRLNYPVRVESKSLVRIEAESFIEPIFKAEFPLSTGKYPTSRFSLVWVYPKTGRYHQIRQHLAHLSHPIVGDTQHGDSKLNQKSKELFGKRRLWLQAYSIRFFHPILNKEITVHSRFRSDWHNLFDLLKVCPYTGRGDFD